MKIEHIALYVKDLEKARKSLMTLKIPGVQAMPTSPSSIEDNIIELTE